MSTSHARALLLVLVAGCGTAYADGTSPAGSASTRLAYVPVLDQPPPPGEKAATPSKTEWAAAPTATEVRITDPSCTAKRLREWYRIECSDSYVSLVTGTRESVEVGTTDATYTAWTVFAARRGDRRVMLMSRRAKWGISSDVIISEQWLAGDPGPLVTALGIPD